MLPKVNNQDKDLHLLQSQWAKQLDPWLRDLPTMLANLTAAQTTITTLQTTVAALGALVPVLAPTTVRLLGGRINSDGTTYTGSTGGFTSSRTGTGLYTLTFTTAFSQIPFCTAMVRGNVLVTVSLGAVSTSSIGFFLYHIPTASNFDQTFDFICAGIP